MPNTTFFASMRRVEGFFRSAQLTLPGMSNRYVSSENVRGVFFLQKRGQAPFFRDHNFVEFRSVPDAPCGKAVNDSGGERWISIY
ncbi:hypothetical protein [Dyella solisilvae]|uniref:hypothetical protein n=1 Tax=Dyella solisilvae TaxID=1920168 RepID=UPI0011C028F6|nr:hypothetical protein [Dyella solisilvae]